MALTKHLVKLARYSAHVEHASTTVIGASFIAEHTASLIVLALFIVLLVLMVISKEAS